MVFLLHVWRLPLAISRFVSRNRILCEATFSVDIPRRNSLIEIGVDAILIIHFKSEMSLGRVRTEFMIVHQSVH